MDDVGSEADSSKSWEAAGKGVEPYGCTTEGQDERCSEADAQQPYSQPQASAAR